MAIDPDLTPILKAITDRLDAVEASPPGTGMALNRNMRMALSKIQLERLEKLADCADNLDALLELSTYVDEIKAFHEYRMASRLVRKTWRGWVIGVAGLIGAGIILKEQAKGFLQWVLG